MLNIIENFYVLFAGKLFAGFKCLILGKLEDSFLHLKVI